MWIAHSSTYEDARVYKLAQALVALRMGLKALESYYHSLSGQNIPPLTASKPHPRFFPYPNSFPEGGGMVRFDYVTPLENNSTCVAFLAETKDHLKVVVKFVDRYGSTVHKFLAEHGYAPRLRYCGPLSPLRKAQSQAPSRPGLSLGALQMVVMDYVTPLSQDLLHLPQVMRPQIEEILNTLHKNGYVFGDLRQPNIILDQEQKVQLIDFDWAGRYDMSDQRNIPENIQGLISPKEANIIQTQTDTTFAHYPLNLSKKLFSSIGARDLQPILPVHDWKMLNNLTFAH